MTNRTVSSRSVYRGWVGTAVLVGAVLGAGEARADYNIKAIEAPNFSLVTDSKCNLAEAIASLNAGKTAAGSGLYGCVNVGGGKKIVLEGTGAHYKFGSNGATITVTGVEITSKVSGKDFIEGAASPNVLSVNVGAGLTLTGLTIQLTGTGFARVLHNMGSLSLKNSVVQGGNTTAQGGGIYNSGALSLSGSKVQNNKAGSNGGGIYTTSVGGVILTSSSTVSNNTSGLSGAGIYCDVSNVSVINSTVSGNKSTSSHAGGIYNYDSTLYLSQATISGNTAFKNGGGIYNYLGVLIMEGGKLTGAHTAANGGGIFNNDGEVSLHSATIEGATASGDGGGIYTQGYNAVSLFQSTVQNNKATGNGGGVYSTALLGFDFDSSTISNNTAGLKGGGIYSFGRCLGKHSTISTNTATGVGGGVYSYKDNTENNNYLELSWTTVGYNRGSQGAGVYLQGHANTQTRSSIIAKNQLWNGTFEDYYGNPHGQDGDDAFYKSVFGECTNTLCRPYDIVGLSNILPLANNGGTTKTHEIPANSSALNKFVAGDGWTCPATDQRGFPRPRPVGAACDLGSYERQ